MPPNKNNPISRNMNTTALNNFIISNQMYCNYFNNFANCSAIYSSKIPELSFYLQQAIGAVNGHLTFLFVWETTSSMLSISEI